MKTTKINFKIAKLLFCGLLLVGLSSCDKDEPATVSTPVTPKKDTVPTGTNSLYPRLTLFQSEATYSRAANTWQRFQLLGGHILSGLTQPMASFAPTTGQYQFPGTAAWEDWRDVAVIYYLTQNILPNSIRFETEDVSTDLLKGMGKVLKVQAAHALVDQLGALPYSKVKSLTDTIADFDLSEDMYKHFFKDLDTAIINLDAATADEKINEYDHIYNGDIAKWKKWLNSLRLRLAIRVRYVDPTLAKTEGEKALAAEVFSSDADAAILNTRGIEREETVHEDTHPYANVFNVYSSVDMNVIQADFASHLNGYDDPRRFNMFETINRTTGWDNTTGKIYGLRIGMGDYTGNAYGSLAGKILKFKGAFYDYVIMSYAEVSFLKAEAALLGWAGAGDAEENYKYGVTSSFAYWGIDDKAVVDAYLNDDTKKPADFVDLVEDTLDISAASTITVKFTGTNEEKLEKIITQKWIALYPDGQEAWSEQRRTGYPKLFPSAFKPAAAFDKNGQRAPRRLPYAKGPTHVFGKNDGIKAKAEAAEAAMGGSDYTPRLWWDLATKNPLP